MPYFLSMAMTNDDDKTKAPSKKPWGEIEYMEHERILQLYEKHVHEQGRIDAFMLSCLCTSLYLSIQKGRGGTRHYSRSSLKNWPVDRPFEDTDPSG